MPDGTTDTNLRSRFLGGMSHAATTVNIVTTDGPAGRAGVTVSAMASVSADTPQPTLLVCVHHLSPAAPRILENGVFCVNVLRDDQSYISDAFAGRFKEQIADKFDCADWVPMPSGAPRVADPLVGFDCRVLSAERVGTHHVLLGEVGDIFVADQGSPLIYANRAYGSARRIDPVQTIGTGRATEGAALAVGCFHSFGPFVLPRILGRMMEETPDLAVSLVEGDSRRVQESLLAGESEVALLYDIGLDPSLSATALGELVPYVLLAEGHPLARRDRLAPADLAGEPMILLDAPPSRDYFLGLLEAEGVVPRIALRSASFEMVRGLVGHGLGFSLLSTRPASPMTYDGRALACRPLASAAAPGRLVLASRKGSPLSDQAARFARHCAAIFRPLAGEP